MTKKHIKMTNRSAMRLPYILACAIAAFLGLSGLAQGQEVPPPVSFEEFGKTHCHNPNAAAFGAALDLVRTIRAWKCHAMPRDGLCLSSSISNQWGTSLSSATS